MTESRYLLGECRSSEDRFLILTPDCKAKSADSK